MTADFTESWLAGPSSTSFYTRTYTPATPQRAALVFVHGFVEHIGRYAHVFPRWAAAGVAVLAYDQRGFGRTALDRENRSPKSVYGKTSSAEQQTDLQWMLDEARRRWPVTPLFLMGHSMVRLDPSLLNKRILTLHRAVALCCHIAPNCEMRLP
jgi:acylglycerol lipase